MNLMKQLRDAMMGLLGPAATTVESPAGVLVVTEDTDTPILPGEKPPAIVHSAEEAANLLGYTILPAGPTRRIGVNQAWASNQDASNYGEKPWVIEPADEDGDPTYATPILADEIITLGQASTLCSTHYICGEHRRSARILTNGPIAYR